MFHYYDSKRMKQLVILLFASTVFSIAGCRHPAGEQETIEKIESYLSELEKAGFSGSILVELNGEAVVSEGYGYCDKEKLIKNTPATIFDIGSITKQFTAAAILKLEMQGKLSTDDKISKFFDKVPADKAQITIHDLLRHQSGLIGNVGRDYEKIGEVEFLDRVFSSTLQYATGTSGSYSNIGYSLLAMIIERASGQSYETYLYHNLWKPAHMETTGYSRPGFDTNRIAVGYHRDNSIWGRPTEKEWEGDAPYWHLKGNGGVLSTTGDLHRWHDCLKTDLVLSAAAKQKMYYPRLRPEETADSYYAYGWDVSRTKRNTSQVWHNGSNRILHADFLRFLDEKVALIMLSNKSHPNFNNVNFEIAKIIFDPRHIPEIPAADNEENRGFTNRIIKTSDEYGLQKAKEEYAKRNPAERLLEFLMREEGFNRIDNGKPEIAIRIFEMNVFVHPNSAKALQGLAEGYMETGKRELALKYFKESLRINPDNRFVLDMIRKLKEQHSSQ